MAVRAGGGRKWGPLSFWCWGPVRRSSSKPNRRDDYARHRADEPVGLRRRADDGNRTETARQAPATEHLKYDLLAAS
jgi:hypothetical protein